MKKFWLSSLLGCALALAAGAYLTVEVLAVPDTLRLANAKPLIAQAAPAVAQVTTAIANPKADVTPTDVTDDEVPANWFDGMIPVVAPILLWLFSLVFPKIPRAFLPFLAPGLGYVIDLIGSATGLSAGNPLMGALLGASGVALREMLNQTTKAMDNRTGVTTSVLLAFLLPAVCLQTGCARLAPDGIYAGNKILHTADETIVGAYGTLHAFVKWEFQNRATVRSEVTLAADGIRANAEKYINSAIAARDAYAATATETNRTALRSSLSVLRAALAIAAQHVAPVKKAEIVSPPRRGGAEFFLTGLSRRPVLSAVQPA